MLFISKVQIASAARSLLLAAASASVGASMLACGEDSPAKDVNDKGNGAEADSDDDSEAPAGSGQDAAQQAPSNKDAGRGNTQIDSGATSPDKPGQPDKPAQSDAGAVSSSSDAGGGMNTGGDKPKFSFFMTSQAALEKLSGNPKGFGGDLRFGKADGLSGADEICRTLAEASMPGNGKTWRAFLSVTKGPDGKPVNAIDRIGDGPWYDRKERLFAMNKAALMSTRPQGAHPVIINDFPNEDGVPNHNPGSGIIDNHNTLTGSTTMGTVDTRGLSATCQDWTSSQAMGGKPRCGVSWPRGMLSHWISILDEGGCAPGATPPGAEAGERGTVGALGGYGGFYCFALTP